MPQKGHWRKWRLKLKNPNNGSSKLKLTRPEYRPHTGPPAQTEKPICTASPLCEGCPFPGHGFLCQGVDGECIEKVVYEFIASNVKFIPFRNKICCPSYFEKLVLWRSGRYIIGRKCLDLPALGIFLGSNVCQIGCSKTESIRAMQRASR